MRYSTGYSRFILHFFHRNPLLNKLQDLGLLLYKSLSIDSPSGIPKGILKGLYKVYGGIM